jgi:hypothetical protein
MMKNTFIKTELKKYKTLATDKKNTPLQNILELNAYTVNKPTTNPIH